MSWQLAALMALTLSAEAEAGSATDTTPKVLNLPYGCAAEVVPAGGLCDVVGTATLGQAGGVPVNWSLYEVTGKERYGLSVLMVPDPAGQAKVAASLRVPAEEVDAWRDDPYVVAALVEEDGAHYAAVSFRGPDGPAAFAVHRVEPTGWTLVDSSGLWTSVQSKLTSVTGPECYPVGGDMNWRTFGLRYDMMSDAGTCGTAFLDLGVEGGEMTVTSALAVRRDLTPAPRRRRGRR